MKVDATPTSDWSVLSEVSILHETAGAGRTSICDNVWVTFFFLNICCVVVYYCYRCRNVAFCCLMTPKIVEQLIWAHQLWFVIGLFYLVVLLADSSKHKSILVTVVHLLR